MLQARRALISVSDKTGLADLARGLAALDIEILSTGGTERSLREAGIAVTAVSEVTEVPEILDGRVKTLHPKIHGGILADRQRSAHAAELAQHGIAPIDLVVVNLYPFRETVASGADFTQAVEMIDIGGPTLIRAAAKNHLGVIVVVDPEDYPQVLTALESGEGTVPEALRRRLALKAFRHTQSYDAAISGWLAAQVETGKELFPRQLTLDLARAAELRYGENPHQQAAVYSQTRGAGIFGGFVQHQGKELSYNNIMDADAARRLVSLMDGPTVAIIKHTNPCGVGVGEDLVTAYQRALACDPISAFGSIVATNGAIDEKLAEAMAELFIEVVIAPEIDESALSLFATKKNRRVLTAPLYRPAP
ncbi:MAG TPA: bifunctional phosphoribosylaminoimidazolecarboxamide formyltransferase/IMP cyclohydrolase, partial [Thermoanaerobaculia bacterium]|nr:bifunctional phosphoribosylaminoimidazolecarboxamide formyltransferase/IMP cyclohydrolase [Thermoanaerobaculia bacterium]